MQEPRQKKVLCTCTVCTWKPIFQCYTELHEYVYNGTCILYVFLQLYISLLNIIKFNKHCWNHFTSNIGKNYAWKIHYFLKLYIFDALGYLQALHVLTCAALQKQKTINNEITFTILKHFIMVIKIQKDRDCGILNRLGYEMQEISRYKYTVYK